MKEIATSRGLAVSTVERHMARGIEAGDVRILDLLSEDVVNEIADKLKERPAGTSEVYNAFNGKYSYGVLRMVQAHLWTN